MKPLNYRKVKSDLNKALSKGSLSPMLRKAIEATVEALDKKNLKLACELTSCKSILIGALQPKNKVYAFQEDSDVNEKVLGNSLYVILDIIHHDLAWQIDEMPSGQAIFSAGPNGLVIQERPSPKGTHPVVRRIKKERDAIKKSVGM
jgi:hypothetical protein